MTNDSMKYLAMIQARCGSSRLPNKVMMDLGGKSALERTIERVRQSKYVDEVIVVTSIQKENLQIVGLCAKIDVRVTVGAENDVLDRFYQAAKLLKPEYLVRVTADCPFYDASFLDNAIEQIEEDIDYLAQRGGHETFPDGQDIEIVRFSALERAWKEAKLQSEREHVTQYIVKHPKLFKFKEIRCPLGDLNKERWTLDEIEDYNMIKTVYNYFISIGRENFTTLEILAYLGENSEVHNLNAMFSRNEGLVTSLANDKIIKER